MARDFDGNDANYLNVGDVAAVDITGTALTLGCWVKFDSVGGPDTIVAKRQDSAADSQYMLSKEDSINVLLGHVFDGGGGYDTVVGATSLGTGAWYHVLLRKNGTGANALQVFVNGILDGGVTSNMSMVNSTGPFTIGGDPSSFWTAVDGLIAETCVWNFALSDPEILALGKGVSPLFIRPQNLKGYWPLYGTGSPERDYSGQGNAATINGTVAAGTRHPPVMPFVFPSVWAQPAPGATPIIATFENPYEAIGFATATPQLSYEALKGLIATAVIPWESGECFPSSAVSQLGEGEPNLRWRTSNDRLRWQGTENLRWSFGEVTVEGVVC